MARRGARRPWGLALVAVAAAVSPVSGQRPDPDSAAQRRAWLRPAASLLLPGSGQLLAGQDRGALYLATEVYVFAQFLRLNHAGRGEARRFRDLAFAVARRPYGPTLRDTTFEYFEQMERFTASGAFSVGSGSGIIPETDPATYNGAVWLLARRTFWDDPNTPPPTDSQAYLRALDFYVRRAIGPNFQWSWRDASLEQQEFRLAIHTSDDAFRRAQSQLGLLLANHLVSAIDALVSNRLSAAARRPAEMKTRLGPQGQAAVQFRFAF
jgi:hypothetical protein